MSISSDIKKYVGPETVMEDFDVSKPKAYAIIHTLNQQLKQAYPEAVVVAGKVNRRWYEQACLLCPMDKKGDG